MTEKQIDTEKELLKTKGRFKTHTKLHLTVLAIVIICELIGSYTFKVGPGNIVLLPMLFAVVIGILITPDVLGKTIPWLRSIISKEECKLASPLLMIALLPLGIKYGTLVGPAIPSIIKAGPAFILQEFGNLGTMVLALPIALLLGLKREAVGATVSISREPTLGIIGEKYGINSPEGNGVLATYLCGTIFGTIFFGLLGGFSTITGLHPYSLAMACGVGSASMMTAGAASLSTAVPAMKDTILAYAAMSNLLTGVTGLYMVLFISLPLTNKLYNFLQPKIQGGKKQ